MSAGLSVGDPDDADIHVDNDLQTRRGKMIDTNPSTLEPLQPKFTAVNFIGILAGFIENSKLEYIKTAYLSGFTFSIF
jgi:hypothetical protein